MSISCESTECTERCELPRISVSGCGGCGCPAGFDGDVDVELPKRGLGRGLCPLIPPKLCLVGVLGADSSAVDTDCEGGGVILGARGVVGVDTSIW